MLFHTSFSSLKELDDQTMSLSGSTLSERKRWRKEGEKQSSFGDCEMRGLLLLLSALLVVLEANGM